MGTRLKREYKLREEISAMNEQNRIKRAEQLRQLDDETEQSLKAKLAEQHRVLTKDELKKQLDEINSEESRFKAEEELEYIQDKINNLTPEQFEALESVIADLEELDRQRNSLAEDKTERSELLSLSKKLIGIVGIAGFVFIILKIISNKDR